jgi:hypothetical protein
VPAFCKYWWLVQHYALSEWATVTWFDVELDLLAFNESLTTIALNLRVVNKDVWLAIDSDEAPTLLVIEPLDGSYSHKGLLNFLGMISLIPGGNHSATS